MYTTHYAVSSLFLLDRDSCEQKLGFRPTFLHVSWIELLHEIETEERLAVHNYPEVFSQNSLSTLPLYFGCSRLPICFFHYDGSRHMHSNCTITTIIGTAFAKFCITFCTFTTHVNIVYSVRYRPL